MKYNPVITIAELAKIHKLNKSQVNFWAKEGLLGECSFVNKTKIFPREEAMARIKAVINFRDRGLPLAELRTLIDTLVAGPV